MSQQQQDNQINKMQKKRGKYKRKWAVEIEIKKNKKKKNTKQLRNMINKIKYICLYMGIKRAVIMSTH